MREFVEQRIIGAVRELLTKRVNEILCDEEFSVPVIEFGDFGGADVVTPTVAISSCEKTEKERIIKLDAYSVSISFELPETVESECQCYAFSTAVCEAIKENPTLGGIADRAVVTGEKYLPPKITNCCGYWEILIGLRVTVEGMME